MNVIPEAIGVYMRASQELSRDLGKLQHQLEIQTKRVENLKKSNEYYVGKKARVVLEPVPRIQTSVHDVVTFYIEQDETWLIGGWAEQAKVIDQELEKQLEEVNGR